MAHTARVCQRRAVSERDELSRAPSIRAGIWVSLEREKRFNADVPFTHLVIPWTAVYAGYSDGHQSRPTAPTDERAIPRAA